MPYGEQLDRLERDLKRLKVEYERFFNGALASPPEELEDRVLRDIRSLQGAQLLSPAERFRLGTLEARYHSFGELFRRRLRDREIGAAPPQRLDTEGPAGPQTDRPVVLDPELASDAVERLYRQLSHRAERKAARTDLDSFRTYLGRQLHLIRQRTGCSRVEMRIVSEDGRVKLKARPLPAAAPTRSQGDPRV